MKAKVVKAFRDKYSGKMYKVGQNLYISKERFEEINRVSPLVEKVDEPKKANNTAK